MPKPLLPKRLLALLNRAIASHALQGQDPTLHPDLATLYKEDVVQLHTFRDALYRGERPTQ